MSHLDEGTLHALLDGELGASEVRQIQAHLSRCATCGTRFEEVKSLRVEADRLVGSLGSPGFVLPAPPVSAAPQPATWTGPVLLIPDPPESVVRRQRRMRVLGWAATIAVAAGAGYFAIETRRQERLVSFAESADEQQNAAPPSPVVSPEESFAKPEPAAPPTEEDTAPTPLAAAAPPEETPNADERGAAVQETVPPTRPADSTLADHATAEADAELAELAKLGKSQRASERAATTDEASLRRLRAAAATADLDRRRREAERREAAARDRIAAETQPAPTPAPVAAPAPVQSIEQRTDVYLRIGLDEAVRQLGSPMHVIEGLSPALIGLTQGRLSPGMDTTRPIVRVVYLDASNRVILLDQQRIRPGQTPPPATQFRVVIGDVVVFLHGEPSATVLQNLAARVR